LILARGFVQALDANKDGLVSREEFLEGFSKWFEKWNTGGNGVLTEAQLRAGINKDLMAFRGGPPPGFGPPPDFEGPPDFMDPDEMR